MFPPQICLLDFASSAPDSPLHDCIDTGCIPACAPAVYDSVVWEDLVIRRKDETSDADDAEGGDAHCVVDAGFGGDGVEMPDCGRFDACVIWVSYI